MSYTQLRGTKTQNFPGSNFLRAKTFQTKCAKPCLTTSLKSLDSNATLLPSFFRLCFLPCTASTDLCLEAFFEQLLRINDPHSLLVSATEDKGLVSTREQKGWQEKGKEKNGGKKIADGKK